MHLRIWILIIAIALSLLAIRPLPELVEGKYVLKSNIKYGLELTGGTRILVEPLKELGPEELEKMREVIETRINEFGLTETDIRVVSSLEKKWIQIEVAETNSSAIIDLIKTEGEFEGRVLLNLNEKKAFKLGERNYEAEILADGVKIGNRTFKDGEKFKLWSGRFEVDAEYENGSLWLTALSGKEILSVSKGIEPGRSPGEFRFGTIISPKGAKIFKDVLQALDIENNRLESNLFLFLDGKLIDEEGLSIQPSFKEIEITNPSVSVRNVDRAKALEEIKKLQAILRAGAEVGKMPSKIKIAEVNAISPSLGKEFLRISFLSLFGAITSVFLIILFRYRTLKISLPILLAVLSEVILIFGLAAFIKWSIDLAAIAGIIAAVGTGVDDQIVITDESIKRGRILRKEKGFKMAFFIIFVAAATTIGALLPLNFVGAGAIKGFALTAIIGILIGVLITRPAYAKILEMLFKEKEE